MRGRLFIIPFVALLVGVLGMTPKADHMTAWVLSLCEALPTDAMLSAFYLPPPMNAWGVRPLSVGVMQVYISLLGAATPPLWLLGLKAGLGALALGLAARAWLRAHGFSAVADWAAAGTLLGSAHLFSSWYLTEFDAWGAAAILAGMTLLRRPNSQLPAHALLAAALLLKESSALVTFSFLSGGMVAALLHSRPQQAIRHARPLILGGLFWMALVKPLLGETSSSMVGATAIADRLPILEHNLAQLVHLATPTGAVVLGLAGLLPCWTRRQRGLVGLALAVLLVLPVVSHQSHYETIYHTPHATSLFLSGSLAFGLLSAGLLSGQHRLARLCAPVVAGQVIFAIAVLGASSLREDFASRLFLAHAPLMLALVLETLRTLWFRLVPARPAIAVLIAATLWGPLAGFFNQAVRWPLQQRQDVRGRQHLVERAAIPADGVVLFNNFQEWLGPEELMALGRDASIVGVPMPALLTAPTLGEDSFGLSGHMGSLETLLEEGTPLWLYWQADRSTMPPEANAALRGDLSWIRRPLGVLTPFAWGKRIHHTSLPMHNAIEDAHLTRFHDGLTPLEVRAREGTLLFEDSQSFIQLPTALLSVPRRLLSAAPVIEQYTADVRIYRLDP